VTVAAPSYRRRIRVTSDGARRVIDNGETLRITERMPFTYWATPVVTRMADIRTVEDYSELQGDWVFVPPDLVTGRDLETAAMISLFTDRLALPEDPLPDPADDDRRGWWADWEFAGGNIGSRLWLISREKQTEEVRRRAEDYCREALQWMIEDDIADTIAITAAWAGSAPGRLEVEVIIARERKVLLTRSYSWAWGQLFNAIR
jgi:phage gp46-like protein